MKILLFILVLSSLIGIGQTKSYEIEISTGSGDFTGGEYIIKIFRRPETIKILYSSFDSVDRVKLYKDPVFQELRNSEPTQERLRKSSEIIKKYKVYTNDSLVISSENKYVGLLDSFYVADQNSVMLPKNRIVLDGIGFRIIQKTNATVDKDFSVNSPTNTFYPEVYRLIKSSLALYREKYPLIKFRGF